MNLKKMKFMIIAIVYGSVLSACSSYNHLNYRSEKQGTKKTAKELDKEAITEVPVDLEKERGIILPTKKAHEAQVDLTAENEGSVLADHSNEKSFPSTLPENNSKILVENFVGDTLEKSANKTDQIAEEEPAEESVGKSPSNGGVLLGLGIILALTIIIVLIVKSVNSAKSNLNW